MHGVAASHAVFPVETANEAWHAGGGRCRADTTRHTGQRHVFPVVEVKADADPGDAFRQAEAIDIDVIDVELVVAADVAGDQLRRADSRWLQGQVRQNVGGFAVVHTQRALQPVRAPLGHQTEVALLVRCEGMTVGKPQKLIGTQWAGRTKARILCTNQRQVVPTILDAVVKAKVGTGFRQSCSVPIQKVLRGDGQFRVEREAGRQLIARDEQFFGFCSGYSQCLGNVQAGLAITVAVGKGQEALPPVEGVLACLTTEQRFIAYFRTPKYECIENLRGRTVVVTIGVTALVPGVGHTTVELVCRSIVAADIIVGMVVPAVGTDAKTHLLFVSHVQFGKYIQTLGNRTTGGEVAIPVIVVPRIGQLAVGGFHALGVVELQRVVEANRKVFIPRVDLHSPYGRDAQAGENGGGQQPFAKVCMADLIIFVHLACHLLYGLRKVMG
ncbi:hypothetical protein D3C86_892460 [compost metagenome]